MKAKILDGRKLAASIKERVKTDAESFFDQNGRRVGLAVILVGDNPASEVYVKNKIKACESCQIRSFSFVLPKSTSEDSLIELIDKLGADDEVDGILVQLPLPSHINQSAVLSRIPPIKDADGFLAENVGGLVLGNPTIGACTPLGIVELIEYSGKKIAGKHAVILGRSNIVGKPAALMLLKKDATVTICHSKTQNLEEITRSADILVVAMGKKEFVTAQMVKDGAIVIDVGMNRDGKRLCGDVDFEGVSEVAGYITPVPGGVGPMTIAMLMSNVVKAARQRQSSNRQK